MLRQITSPLFRRTLLAKDGGIVKRNAATKVALRNTMDDLPIPNGSWETQYKANQTKYNMHLAIGVIFTAVTLVTARASGLFNLYISPPPLPKD
ncbi:unnamed protein product [Nezara viridula]|uniref:Deltamethrin resistance protein prag01 domain-containing protein n=1 Tax=Nezara viridula TaxID=85310 RepID=A0A9P0MU30_NEZVI|nr:unnamed protein product [Nezara viridula]